MRSQFTTIALLKKLAANGLFFLLAFMLITCSDNPGSPNSEPEPEPEPKPTPEVTVGNLDITTVTTGLDPDPRGYTILVENGESIDAGPNEVFTLEEIDEGTYSVELSDVEEHCTVQSANPVSVEIVAEQTSTVEFEIECAGIFREKVVFFRNGTQNAKTGYSLAQQSYYAMNYDGSGLERVKDLNFDGRINFSSDISPDGTKMAVIYMEDREFDSRIGIINAYDDELIFLNDLESDVSYFYPVFSPDGSKIAYIKTSDSSTKRDIYIMDSDGTNIVQVTTSGALEENLNWSADGSKIIFERSTKDYKYQGIYSVNTDGTGEKLITDSEMEFTDPVWSPNGDKIAVVGSQFEPYYYNEVFVMNPDGTNIQKIASKEGQSIYYSGLKWSPDGTKIYFLSNRDGQPDAEFGYAYASKDIFMVNADGSNLVNITNTPQVDESNLMLTP